jgi:hypothetical protein
MDYGWPMITGFSVGLALRVLGWHFRLVPIFIRIALGR